jgi:hypothetical protein
MATPGQASIASVTPDSQSPADRAGAVLRAAEAAAHAAALRGAPEPEPAPATSRDHQAQVLAATGELEAHLAQARARLDALERALAEPGTHGLVDQP